MEKRNLKKKLRQLKLKKLMMLTWQRLKKSFSMAKQIVSTVGQASIEKISL